MSIVGLLILMVALASQNVQASLEDGTVTCLEKAAGNNDEQVAHGARCEAEEVSKYPWSIGATRTAPAPTSITAAHKVVNTPGLNTSFHIRIFVTWKQRDLIDVEQFHLEVIHMEPPGTATQYVMTFNNLSSTAGVTTFSFSCCGAHGSFPVNPGDMYALKIQALPMYQEDGIPQAIRTNITIPGCKDTEIRKTDECRRRLYTGKKNRRNRNRHGKRKPVIKPTSTVAPVDTTLTAPEEWGFWNAVNCVLLVVGGMVAVTMAFVLFLSCRHKRICHHEGKVSDSRNILLISTNEERYLGLINYLIRILEKYKKSEIISNVRSKVEIGDLGITDWAKEKIIEAEHVLYLPAFEHEHICRSLDNQNAKEHQQIAVAIRVADNIILTSNMEHTQNKFLAVDLNDCIGREQMIFCKHYNLSADLEKLLKHILGCRSCAVSKKEKALLRKYLSQARLDCTAKRTTEEEEKENLAAQIDENNLDFSPCPSLEAGSKDETRPPDDFNIVDDCNSVNVYERELYLTTDFNDNAQNRYTKGGARPKRDC